MIPSYRQEQGGSEKNADQGDTSSQWQSQDSAPAPNPCATPFSFRPWGHGWRCCPPEQSKDRSQPHPSHPDTVSPVSVPFLQPGPLSLLPFPSSFNCQEQYTTFYFKRHTQPASPQQLSKAKPRESLLRYRAAVHSRATIHTVKCVKSKILKHTHTYITSQRV